MLSIVSAAFAKLQARQERQRVLNELYALDDRALADIGICRADIPFVIGGADSQAAGPRFGFRSAAKDAASSAA